ncbi:hypothetical protein BG011_001243 [Mortierella polycephala]|uniref:C2H2-type domain-containing protein n=1 Tax=Mortierella polycephala TaxID=41804 RepID=A0A9P6PJ70_9FUNG|nr:hypothetical protein BG011_001243 [Mortierella polycephala]
MSTVPIQPTPVSLPSGLIMIHRPIQPSYHTAASLPGGPAPDSAPVTPVSYYASQEALAPPQPQHLQQPHDQYQQQQHSYAHVDQDGYLSLNLSISSNDSAYHYYDDQDPDQDNHSSPASSKQTSPAPSRRGRGGGNNNRSKRNSKAKSKNDNNYDDNDYDADNGDQDTSNDRQRNQQQQGTKGAKGKIFQCTGFGDCRMVFTRSEHLARHARKHTGEKPFKCVVEGCTRMFSRFDNMVQHTQTHTKGVHPESSEDIANKIAIESRRKSEIGQLAGPTGRRVSIKGPKAKRGSVSSASGSEAPELGRRDRVQSTPVLNMTALKNHRSSTPVLPSPVTPSSSSPHSPKKHLRQRGLRSAEKQVGPIRKKSLANIMERRGSIASSTVEPQAESWYASKLHHRPSLDFGLDQHAYVTNGENYSAGYAMDVTQLSQVNPFHAHRQDFSVEPSSSARPRHPMSPVHSSHSEDMDSDDAGYYIQQQQHLEQQPSLNEGFVPLHPLDPRMIDSMDNCTLPPLRSSPFPPETRPRLPSISHGRYRSQSIHSNTGSYPPEPYPTSKTRRLSIVDLNAPIQEATKAASNVREPEDQTMTGVDVSEDEIKALEAFGELWSQGRDIEMNERRSVEPNVPGPDFGRRVLSPPHGNDERGQTHGFP